MSRHAPTKASQSRATSSTLPTSSPPKRCDSHASGPQSGTRRGSSGPSPHMPDGTGGSESTSRSRLSSEPRPSAGPITTSEPTSPTAHTHTGTDATGRRRPPAHPTRRHRPGPRRGGGASGGGHVHSLLQHPAPPYYSTRPRPTTAPGRAWLRGTRAAGSVVPSAHAVRAFSFLTGRVRTDRRTLEDLTGVHRQHPTRHLHREMIHTPRRRTTLLLPHLVVLTAVTRALEPLRRRTRRHPTTQMRTLLIQRHHPRLHPRQHPRRVHLLRLLQRRGRILR